MNWLQPLDLYCERIGHGLLAEPLNAASNLGFVAAGLWLALQLPRRMAPLRVPLPYDLLAGMIVLIGICSAAFHTFAVKWAEVLDVASIALFIHFFMVCFAHYVLDVRWQLAWMAAPAFFAFGTIVTGPFEPGAYNGSVSYFPALAGLSLIAAGLASRRRPGWTLFAGAAGLFLLAVTLRSLDQALCRAWPWGTHWAWHLLNAGTLTLVMLGLVKARERRRIPG